MQSRRWRSWGTGIWLEAGGSEKMFDGTARPNVGLMRTAETPKELGDAARLAVTGASEGDWLTEEFLFKARLKPLAGRTYTLRGQALA